MCIKALHKENENLKALVHKLRRNASSPSVTCTNFAFTTRTRQNLQLRFRAPDILTSTTASKPTLPPPFPSLPFVFDDRSTKCSIHTQFRLRMTAFLELKTSTHPARVLFRHVDAANEKSRIAPLTPTPPQAIADQLHAAEELGCVGAGVGVCDASKVWLFTRRQRMLGDETREDAENERSEDIIETLTSPTSAPLSNTPRHGVFFSSFSFFISLSLYLPISSLFSPFSSLLSSLFFSLPSPWCIQRSLLSDWRCQTRRCRHHS